MTTASAGVVGPSPPDLMPSGFVGDKTSLNSVFEERHLVGTRQRIVHQRSAQRLTGVRIDIAPLGKGLSETRDDRAVRLPVDDQRIDDPADVVYRDVAR